MSNISNNASHQDAWHQMFHSVSTSDPPKNTFVHKKNPNLASRVIYFLRSPQETEAHRNAHQSFQSALEEKYGREIAAFAFAKSKYNERDPLTLRKIKKILKIASTAEEIKHLNDQADYLKDDLQEIYDTLEKNIEHYG